MHTQFHTNQTNKHTPQARNPETGHGGGYTRRIQASASRARGPLAKVSDGFVWRLALLVHAQDRAGWLQCEANNRGGEAPHHTTYARFMTLLRDTPTRRSSISPSDLLLYLAPLSGTAKRDSRSTNCTCSLQLFSCKAMVYLNTRSLSLPKTKPYHRATLVCHTSRAAIPRASNRALSPTAPLPELPHRAVLSSRAWITRAREFTRRFVRPLADICGLCGQRVGHRPCTDHNTPQFNSCRVVGCTICLIYPASSLARSSFGCML